MPAGLDLRRERRAIGSRRSLFKTSELAVERTLLAADSPHLAAVPGRIPTDRHSCRSAFAGAEKRDLGSEIVFIPIVCRLEMLDPARHSHARHMGETPAGYADVIGV